MKITGNQELIYEVVLNPNQTIVHGPTYPFLINVTNESDHRTFVIRVYEVEKQNNLSRAKAALLKK